MTKQMKLLIQYRYGFPDIKMIDPTNITDYNRSIYSLQEVLLFWICAAGKNAISAARGLEKFLERTAWHTNRRDQDGKLVCSYVKRHPFNQIRTVAMTLLPGMLK